KPGAISRSRATPGQAPWERGGRPYGRDEKLAGREAPYEQSCHEHGEPDHGPEAEADECVHPETEHEPRLAQPRHSEQKRRPSIEDEQEPLDRAPTPARDAAREEVRDGRLVGVV